MKKRIGAALYGTGTLKDFLMPGMMSHEFDERGHYYYSDSSSVESHF